MLETLVREVATKFGLASSTVQSLATGLISMISTDSHGLAGFLDKFKAAGLGDMVSSWIGSASPPPMTADQLERALGRDTVQTLATRAGAPMSAAASALAFFVPKLVGELTPGGSVPSVLPASVSSFLSSSARQAAAVVEPIAKGTPRWLWPLLLGLLLLGLLWYFFGRGPATTTWNYADYMKTANARAMTALEGLRPGLSGDSMIRALNLQVVNFATGAADVPEEARPLLNASATAMKLAPAGTIVEIGGHTDNTGDAASNDGLSLRRAEAVRAYLITQSVPSTMLTARGYGQSRPVGPNDTEEGRFRNRRIEYTLTKWGN